MPGVKNKSGGKRPGAGRLPFKPSEEQRERVQELAGLGARHSDIPRLMTAREEKPISGPTLRKHFSSELKIGKEAANVIVAKTLFDKATKGNDTTAMIFWLKCQAGWTDRQRVELTGANGGPVQSITTATNDPVEAAKIYQQMMNS